MKEPRSSVWHLTLGAPPAGAEAANNEARSTPVGDAYWAKRQALLAEQHSLDFGRDKLNAHEIEFYERFLADGSQVITPIKRDEHNSEPRSDFDWLNMSVRSVEVKTILAPEYDGRTMVRPVREAVKKALKAGRVKANFMIDIRDDELPEPLLAVLAQYNVANPHARIERLFVFSRGQVSEVPLMQ